MTQRNDFPEFQKERFNCPHCQAYAAMSWSHLNDHTHFVLDFVAARCESCRKMSIWLTKTNEALMSARLKGITEGQMVYPTVTNAAHAHPSMPEIIKQDYEEARQIAVLSPRASAALLRLCIEKLCRHLTSENIEINQQIGKLVEKGLSVRIQKALDVVRVIGNEAVHPGTIDVDDSEKYVYPLFKLVNHIIEELIAVPAEIDDIFDSLPQGKRDGITQRDAKKKREA